MRYGYFPIYPGSPLIVSEKQVTEKGIIHWQSFNLDADEKAQFNQPGATSITLNRVIGNDPSRILGQISANGQVILINRAGVIFGKGATVDVAGLIATTANTTNSDFQAGHCQLTEEAGSIQGVIQEGTKSIVISVPLV